MDRPGQPVVPHAAQWRVVEVALRQPGAHARALETLRAQGWEVHHTQWVRQSNSAAPRMAFVVAWRVDPVDLN